MNQPDLFTTDLGAIVASATSTDGLLIDTWTDPKTGVVGTATFSPCRRYRYGLTRSWAGLHAPFLMVIGLNPSTATARDDDPTIRRCIGFAKDWGFGRLLMTNAFAFRARDPDVMKVEADPIGPQNDRWLVDAAKNAGVVLAAWGVHGVHLDRAAAVAKMLPNLQCLGLSRDGHPRHPLYMPKTATPQPFIHP